MWTEVFIQNVPEKNTANATDSEAQKGQQEAAEGVFSIPAVCRLTTKCRQITQTPTKLT